MSSSSRREQHPSQPAHGQPQAEKPAPSLAGHNPTQTSESSLSGIAGAVKDKAQELASSFGSRGEDVWNTTKQGARQAASAVASTAESAWDEVSRFVRHHPLATLAAGGGVAFLLIRSMAESSGPDYNQTTWRERAWERDFPEQQRGYRAGRSSYSPPWERREPRSEESATATGNGGFGERAQEMASAAAERAGQAWESTREGARQLASTVANRAEDAWETMGDWGRGYPLGTLVVGAALGFGLNELLRSQGLLGCQAGSQQRTSGAEMNLRPGSSRF